MKRLIVYVMTVSLLMPSLPACAEESGWLKDLHRKLESDSQSTGLRLELQPLASEPAPPACSGRWKIELAVGVRWPGVVGATLTCAHPAWRGSVHVIVRAFASVLEPNRMLPTGSVIGAADLFAAEAEIQQAGPPPWAADRAEVIGREAARPLRERQPIPLNALRAATVIRQGEHVSVQVVGVSFQASGEGVALQAGAVGDSIRVKLPDGRQISGQVLRAGVVELKL